MTMTAKEAIEYACAAIKIAADSFAEIQLKSRQVSSSRIREVATDAESRALEARNILRLELAFMADNAEAETVYQVREAKIAGARWAEIHADRKDWYSQAPEWFEVRALRVIKP